jgi:hypothetical protein
LIGEHVDRRRGASCCCCSLQEERERARVAAATCNERKERGRELLLLARARAQAQAQAEPSHTSAPMRRPLEMALCFRKLELVGLQHYPIFYDARREAPDTA